MRDKNRDARGRFVPGNNANPKGRPKDGQSWSAIISELGDMYPEDISEFIPKSNPLGREIAKLPKSVQMKYLVIMRVYAALMFDPTSGLLKEFMDRMEGKVPDKFQADLSLNVTGITEMLDKAYGNSNDDDADDPS